jgi:hypothetical protein
MAQTYTLEEAAIRLGIPTDDFKRRLREEWKTVRSFRDGPTLRFRAADIDELARSLGQASEPELQMSEPVFDLGESSDEMLVVSPPPSSGRLKAKPPIEAPLLLSDDTDDIFTVPSGDSSVSKNKPKSNLAADSDVRLDTTPPRLDPDADHQTEEFTLELAPPASGILKKKSSVNLNAPSSGKLSAPSSGRLGGPESNRIPGPKAAMPADDGSSEFELKLEDSDSFELELRPDDSDEVDLGGSIADDNRAGQSGINLAKPKDSGVSLESPDASDDSDIEFDLSLDAPGASGSKLAAPKSGGRAEENSDSEFELSLEDSSGEMQPLVEDDGEVAAGDIFETDFELPAVTGDESGSEVIALDSDTDLEDSDFEVAIDEGDAPLEDESASQVMLVDDEEAAALEVDEDAAMLVDEDGFSLADEDEDSVAGALKGVHRGEGDVEVRTVAAPPAKWGVLPVLFLFPCFVAVILGGLMSFEMVRGMWGYQQPVKTSDSLVRGMASQFDLKVSD